VNCQYCGKGFWLASKVVDDPDFCNPTHRWKFRKRLETGIAMIRRSSELCAIKLAGFQDWTQDPQALEHLHLATACALFTRMHAIAAAGMPLSVSADAPLIELGSAVTDGSTDLHWHPHVSEEKRLEGVTELVAGLRADIEKRRMDRGKSRLCRGPVLFAHRSLASASA
jgi:hypothetical protein